MLHGELKTNVKPMLATHIVVIHYVVSYNDKRMEGVMRSRQSRFLGIDLTVPWLRQSRS